MRKLVLAPIAAALVAVAGGATASAGESRFVGTYFNYSLCTGAGQAGVADGRWDSYDCRGKRVGREYWYDLYVSP